MLRAPRFFWSGLLLPCLWAWACSSPEDAAKDTAGGSTGTTGATDTAEDTSPPEDTGEEAIRYISYEGTLAYFYGQGRPEVRDYECELYWEIDPTDPATPVEDCPDCTFAFSVPWVLDTIFSEGSGGGCDSDRNGNFTLELGFREVEDLPGTYTGYLVERVDGAWVDRSMATFDPLTGQFTFSNGLLDEAREEGGVTVFDSDVFYGTANVWDGSPREEDGR